MHRGEDGGVRLTSEGGCRFRLELFHDLPRDRGLDPDELLSERGTRALAALRVAAPRGADAVDRQLQELALLAYEDRFLAGSWRFLTYFGRDTILSLRMMAPVLSDRALAAGLRSVVSRLSPEGMVAHEEGLGDQAAFEHLQEAVERSEQAGPSRALAALLRRRDSLGARVLDRAMVDDDLMLPGLAADALERGVHLSEELVALLLHNLDYVTSRLLEGRISLREGRSVGDWRDSQEGLGFNPDSWSVNAGLTEPACRALARLAALVGYQPKVDLVALAAEWRARRAGFRIELEASEVRSRLAAFLAS
jgi:hypothetical protein